MAANRISQREARRLRQRVARLEERIRTARRAWSSDYPGGIELGRLRLTDLPAQLTAVRIARKLSFAVVCTTSGDDLVMHALPAVVE